MELRTVDHPLVAHKLTLLRDQTTDSPTFRRLTEELVTLLAYEATREVRVAPHTVQTPLQAAVGVKLAQPRPLVVPILRAGLGMLEGMTRLIPTAEVGFVGMVRNETTLIATTYAERLPTDLTGRQCYLLDPMLATGGSAVAAVDVLKRWGLRRVQYLGLIAAPEGVAALRAAHPDVPIHLAAIDDRLTIRSLLDRLPERERRILILRFFGNMTQSQIAADIGISQMHVSRLLSQTLAKLREGLLKD